MVYDNPNGIYLIAGLMILLCLKFVFVFYQLGKAYQSDLTMEEAKFQAQRQREAQRKQQQEAFERKKEERKTAYQKQQNAYVLSSRRISRFASDFEFYENCRDPYVIIGCTLNASMAQMKKSYRTLVKKWHPDIITAMNVTKEEMQEATRIMQIINIAYDEAVRRKAA